MIDNSELRAWIDAHDTHNTASYDASCERGQGAGRSVSSSDGSVDRLPRGWRRSWSKTHNRPFYWHKTTRQQSWFVPEDSPREESAQRPATPPSPAAPSARAERGERTTMPFDSSYPIGHFERDAASAASGNGTRGPSPVCFAVPCGGNESGHIRKGGDAGVKSEQGGARQQNSDLEVERWPASDLDEDGILGAGEVCVLGGALESAGIRFARKSSMPPFTEAWRASRVMLVVAALEADSAADWSGIIQLGDVLVSVDGCPACEVPLCDGELVGPEGSLLSVVLEREVGLPRPFRYNTLLWYGRPSQELYTSCAGLLVQEYTQEREQAEQQTAVTSVLSCEVGAVFSGVAREERSCFDLQSMLASTLVPNSSSHVDLNSSLGLDADMGAFTARLTPSIERQAREVRAGLMGNGLEVSATSAQGTCLASLPLTHNAAAPLDDTRQYAVYAGVGMQEELGDGVREGTGMRGSDGEYHEGYREAGAVSEAIGEKEGRRRGGLALAPTNSCANSGAKSRVSEAWRAKAIQVARELCADRDRALPGTCPEHSSRADSRAGEGRSINVCCSNFSSNCTSGEGRYSVNPGSLAALDVARGASMSPSGLAPGLAARILRGSRSCEPGTVSPLRSWEAGAVSPLWSCEPGTVSPLRSWEAGASQEPPYQQPESRVLVRDGASWVCERGGKAVEEGFVVGGKGVILREVNGKSVEGGRVVKSVEGEMGGEESASATSLESAEAPSAESVRSFFVLFYLLPSSPLLNSFFDTRTPSLFV